MFSPQHYSARACDLEDAAKDVTSRTIRERYLELARSYREMANLAAIAEDVELVRLAERIVGKTTDAR